MATAQDPDPRPLPGEPLAIDLLNTQWLASGGPSDLLATPEGTQAWLNAAGVPAGSDPGTQTRLALIAARQAIRDVLTEGGEAAAARLNAVLEHARLRLSFARPGEPRPDLDADEPAWRPAVLAAASFLDLLERAPDRIRSCQHPACVLWFFDTTRTGTRRWCSMTTCGNRAKAHRHYERSRAPDREGVR